MIKSLRNEKVDTPSRAKFYIGERVRLTASGMQQLPNTPRRGIVLRYCLNPNTVFVQPDGYKTGHEYGLDHWECE